MQGDYGELDELSESEPSYPVKVQIAAIVWIVVGAVILLNGFGSFIINASNPAVPQEGARPVAAAEGVCGVLIVVLFGGAFIFVGYQTIKGTAKDTLGNAIGSIVLGLLCLTCGGFGVVGALAISAFSGMAKAGTQSGLTVAVLIVIGVVYLLAGFALLGAGVLALAGREDYKTWRRWHKRRAGPRED